MTRLLGALFVATGPFVWFMCCYFFSTCSVSQELCTQFTRYCVLLWSILLSMSFGISSPQTAQPYTSVTLQWRHNGRGCISNHQPNGCLLNRLFRRRWKKTSKLRVTDVGVCVCVFGGGGGGGGVHRGGFPAQRASNAENISIWWRHHADKQPWQIWANGSHGSTKACLYKYIHTTNNRAWMKWPAKNFILFISTVFGRLHNSRVAEKNVNKAGYKYIYI